MIYVIQPLVTLFWIFVLDGCEFRETIADWYTSLMERILHVPLTIHYPKPFTCSRCMGFHTNWIILCFVHPDTLLLIILALVEDAFLATITPKISKLIERVNI